MIPIPIRMKYASPGDNAAAADVEQLPLDRTMRIEPDRRRLALRVLASSAALLAICVALVMSAMHGGRWMVHGQQLPPEFDAVLQATALPWWTFIALIVALVSGGVGLLRNVYRLQDADAALVISPRGVSFRPTVFGEIARIPWAAIRGVRLRRYKQHRFIALQVEDVDRYVSHLAARDRVRRLFSGSGRAPEISISVPLARAVWLRTERLIERYRAHYGRSDDDAAGGPASRAGGRAPRG